VPRRYIDLSRKRAIGELKIGEEATVEATVAKVEGRFLRSRRHMLTVTVSDGSGYLQLLWWNQQFRQRNFTVGQSFAVAGRVDRSKVGRRGPVIVNPFVEPLERSGVHVGRIIPVHPATQGVSPNQIRRFVHDALKRYGEHVAEALPEGILGRAGLMDRASAIREMHFPKDRGSMTAARKRLVLEELIVLSTGLAMRKHRLRKEADGIVHAQGSDLVDRFLSSLPFDPTSAQRRAIAEIASDMANAHPMNRLLQGEVGSGKTVVAIAAALIAHASGSQTAFMAPTEVLAEQHYLTVRRMLEPLRDEADAPDGRLFGDGFEVVLLTGSVTGRDRARALELAASGGAMMLIGTHALIQEGVSFARLGMAIVDEQHRFGVHQRVSLRTKGERAQPDTLIMTATPIPRTLALTLYGDLDVSTLDEMPPGRTPIETVVVSDEAGRAAAYDHIREEVAAGRQAFIVCPLVEDSSSLEVKAAESEYERIRAEVFPSLKVGLIHGRMKSQEKEEVMTAVRAGSVDVLVATTVIEVGVDVPNATVMVVEDADRFGLSQLHQLRGRIGRGRHPGRCFLFTTVDLDASDAREDAVRRLEAMAATTDGFHLAEVDLEIRGAGQLFGRGAVEEGSGAPLQTGRGDLRFANLVRDRDVFTEAHEIAFALVADDPTLSEPQHRALHDEVLRRFADRLDWLFAS
jgi:ATP-dependent DNA helicase RecG